MTEERMKLIRPLLNRYRRRFTVLDLGCGNGEIIGAIGREYDAMTVAMDRLPLPDLGQTVRLQSDIQAPALERLTLREHFDVVIAMNFLHHFQGKGHEQVARCVLNMGQHVFLQLPPRGTHRVAGEEILDDLHDAVEEDGAALLGSPWYPSFNHRRPLWLKTNPSGRYVSSGAPRGWTVDASFVAITGCRPGDTRVWIPGINFWTMHGLGADRDWLIGLVKSMPLPEIEHGDITPWNMIWDGRRIHLIDSQHEYLGHKACADPDGQRQTIRLLSLDKNTDWT